MAASNFEHGVFSWVDLVAHDMNAAAKWYCELFGWEMKSQDTQGWYGDRLDPDWRPATVDRLQGLLTAAALAEPLAGLAWVS